MLRFLSERQERTMISMSAVNSIRQQRKGKLIHHKRRLEPTRLTPLRPLRSIDRLINLSYHLLHRMKRMNRFAERGGTHDGIFGKEHCEHAQGRRNHSRRACGKGGRFPSNGIRLRARRRNAGPCECAKTRTHIRGQPGQPDCFQ